MSKLCRQIKLLLNSSLIRVCLLFHLHTVKHLISAVSKFRDLMKKHSWRLNLVVMNTMSPENKQNVVSICNIFLTFLLHYTLWYLLESPHGGDSNGLPHCSLV